MEIRYRDIILRDYREADIEDDIRWYTVETQWALWDAPWEMEEELRKIDPESFRQKQLAGLGEPLPDPRWRFEVDTAEGVHIGGVNTYLIDGNCDWIALKDVKPGQRVCDTVGVDICEPAYWGKGLGTQALAAFVQYLLDSGSREICCQTWSGNERMIRCAHKLGFVEHRRKPGIREVRGGVYDGLTFRLDPARFAAYLAGDRT